jgi:hypothetical protein
MPGLSNQKKKTDNMQQPLKSEAAALIVMKAHQ